MTRSSVWEELVVSLVTFINKKVSMTLMNDPQVVYRLHHDFVTYVVPETKTTPSVLVILRSFINLVYERLHLLFSLTLFGETLPSVP